ncbi:MAG: hypothetical protein WCF08_07975 [Anaerolineaceae bacterium]
MPVFLLIGGAVILLITVIFSLQNKSTPYTPDVTGGPSLQVYKEVLDLGDMKFESMANVSFKLTNIGDKPLHFTEAPYIEVKEGC